MKRGKKEIVAMGLVVSVLCSSVNAKAYNSSTGMLESKLRCDEKYATNSEMVMTASTRLDISGRIASVDVSITCDFNVDTIDAELILQIYAESAWPTVTSWKYTEQDCILLEDEEFTLNASGTYRTKCVITAHVGSKKEKITIYSGEKKYTHKS